MYRSSFLSDPGKPGVRSLGPDVRPSLTHRGFANFTELTLAGGRITWVKVENLVTNLSPNLVTNWVITKLGDILGDIFGDIFGDILGDYQIW